MMCVRVSTGLRPWRLFVRGFMLRVEMEVGVREQHAGDYCDVF
jgi:hypothetical protein